MNQIIPFFEFWPKLFTCPTLEFVAIGFVLFSIIWITLYLIRGYCF